MLPSGMSVGWPNTLHRMLIWLAVVLAASVPALADERILLFDSTIEVNTDGSLLVREKIRVRAEGRNIRRGIYRDFPVRYREAGGYRRRVGFKLLSLTRNGKPEANFSENSGDHRRVYAGEKSVFLPHGEHEYEITYRTTRQLRHFDDYDELYWNVTGNNWQFPIDRVVARIKLPGQTEIINSTAYTGRFGNQGKDYRVAAQAPGAITFESSRPLAIFEGLTVALAWPKGVVHEPGASALFWWRLWDNLGFVLLITGTVAVTAFYYFMWSSVGRDPPGGAIFPRFGPPDGMSPAAVSYLHHMGFSRAGSGATKPFIAALISLAVKGRIIIDETGKDVVVRRTGSTGDGGLPSGEQALLNYLLGQREELVFRQSSHPYVQTARRMFKSAVLKENGGIFFKNNYGWFAVGFVASAIIVGLSLLLIREEQLNLVILAATALSVVGFYALSTGIGRLGNWLPGSGSRFFSLLLAVIGVVLVALAFLTPLTEDRLPALVLVFAIVLGAVNALFVHLMRAPTVLGRQMMDAIEGFKMYLTVAEAERMNMAGAPDVTAEIFEKYLPYAIGLGVEKPWSNAFEAHLAKTTPPGEHRAGYRPGWHRGYSDWDSDGLRTATAGLVGAVSAGMASASPPSSSGSGGGGFSGGGGGGGGGGGW